MAAVALEPSILRDRVLKILTPEERWVIFVGPHELHSNLLSWRQSLDELIEISLDDEGLPDMDSLKLKLEAYKNSDRPMLGSFSACSNVTGIYSDMRAIATLLHQYNGFECFDFAAGYLLANQVEDLLAKQGISQSDFWDTCLDFVRPLVVQDRLGFNSLV
ncbi:hypothetical protein QN277_020217 [Acacia crassicarpa]|uniref:Aminotransferase class V domain-containing protein n=1 Tax=Acacia crassicarpa TaxID=499986 RepID=A0AAE1JL17_9FABA|nr:hypothetical protein QN277_020217 [Acacia crassicarpa]